MNDALSTYAEIIDVITNLPIIVRERRRADILSLRTAATQIGCSASTISRLEEGKGTDTETVLLILKWLNTPSCGQGPPTPHIPANGS